MSESVRGVLSHVSPRVCYECVSGAGHCLGVVVYVLQIMLSAFILDGL